MQIINISMYSVMKTPGLIIRQKIVSISKVPNHDELKDLIKKILFSDYDDTC